jgi:hypothetical protein
VVLLGNAAADVLEERPPFTPNLVRELREAESRKNAGPFDPNGLQLPGIDSKRLEDGWSHLRGTNSLIDRTRVEPAVREQQHGIRVVMGEAAMLGKFGAAA